jgi:hypothetical protein
MNTGKSKFGYGNAIIFPSVTRMGGYSVFVELAYADGADSKMLKMIYLSMHYAESTIRLLFRNLENGGWIAMPGNELDKRACSFVLTEKFLRKQEKWV